MFLHAEKNSRGGAKLNISSHVRLSAQRAQILALCTLLSRWTEGYTCMTCLSQQEMQKSARVTTSSRECAVDWVKVLMSFDLCPQVGFQQLGLPGIHVSLDDTSNADTTIENDTMSK